MEKIPTKLRGRPYTLEEFSEKYALPAEEAESIFKRFGPSSVELDLLMSAKGIKPVNA